MWTIEDLKKLAGLNFLRVFREVERVNIFALKNLWNLSTKFCLTISVNVFRRSQHGQKKLRGNN